MQKLAATKCHAPLRRQLDYKKADAGQVAARAGKGTATMPRPTGSSPALKTMGMVVVAALAASAADTPPVETSTATWRRTKSAASAGNRSSSLLAQRYSIARFSPST